MRDTSRTDHIDNHEPRGRLLFERAVVVACLKGRGLPTGEIEPELPPFVGVRTLARLLDVSPSWIRALHKRGVMRGRHFKPPLQGEAA